MLLKTKILSGFSAGALICFLVGLLAIVMSSLSNSVTDEAVKMSQMEKELNNAIKAHIEWKSNLQQTFVNNDEKISVEMDGHKCGFGKWFYGEGLEHLGELSEEAAENIKAIEKTHLDLHSTAEDISANWTQKHTGLSEELESIFSGHKDWALNLSEDLLNNRKSSVETDHTKCRLGKYLDSEESRELEKKWPEYAEEIKQIKKHHELLHNSVIAINSSGNPSARSSIFLNTTKTELDQVGSRFMKIISLEKGIEEKADTALNIFKNNTSPLINQVTGNLEETSSILNREAERLNLHADKVVKQQFIIIIIGVAIGIIVAVLLGLIITSSVMKQCGEDPSVIQAIAEKISEGDLVIEFKNKNPVGVYKSMKIMAENLTDIVKNISSSADQVTAGSEQISESSQQISSGANEQASSTEELSSSMEELAANIQMNNENSIKSNSITKEVVKNAENGEKAVRATAEAMKNIAEKIGIIEDIARNTNMLALNAAIEAARAGEAGKGFAVVASEVRKLAENSQKAAGEITEISTSSLASADEARLVIEHLIPEIRSVSELIEEITNASNEQSTGAGQINNAIMQLDSVIQQNASFSEEMASMAEELSSQAETMNNTIGFFKTDSSKSLKAKKESESKKKESESDIIDDKEYKEF